MELAAKICWIISSLLWWAWWPPALWRLIKEKDSTGQSITAWICGALGGAFAIAAGMLWGNFTIAVTEGLIGVGAVVMIWLTIKYRRKKCGSNNQENQYIRKPVLCECGHRMTFVRCKTEPPDTHHDLRCPKCKKLIDLWR